MVSFLQVAKAVNTLATSTYWIHESTLAKRIGVTCSDLEGWVKCVREGGSGAKSKNIFQPNPAPYNVKIDLADLSADNILNLQSSLPRKQAQHHSKSERRSLVLVQLCQILLRWYVGELSVNITKH